MKLKGESFEIPDKFILYLLLLFVAGYLLRLQDIVGLFGITCFTAAGVVAIAHRMKLRQRKSVTPFQTESNPHAEDEKKGREPF